MLMLMWGNTSRGADDMASPIWNLFHPNQGFLEWFPEIAEQTLLTCREMAQV